MTTSDTSHTKRHQTATRAAGSAQIEDRRRRRQRQPAQRRGCTAPASNAACTPHVFARPLLSGRPQPSLSERRTVSGYTLTTSQRRTSSGCAALRSSHNSTIACFESDDSALVANNQRLLGCDANANTCVAYVKYWILISYLHINIKHLYVWPRYRLLSMTINHWSIK